jgi:hypothetical protein
LVKFFRSAASNWWNFASLFAVAQTAPKYASHAVSVSPVFGSLKSAWVMPAANRCGSAMTSVATWALVSARAAASVSPMMRPICESPYRSWVRCRFDQRHDRDGEPCSSRSDSISQPFSETSHMVTPAVQRRR